MLKTIDDYISETVAMSLYDIIKFLALLYDFCYCIIVYYSIQFNNIIQVHRVLCTLGQAVLCNTMQKWRYLSDMGCNNMNWSAVSGSIMGIRYIHDTGICINDQSKICTTYYNCSMSIFVF